MIEKLIALQAIVIFIAGVLALRQVIFDKKNQEKAIVLLVAGIVVLTIGCFVLFKEPNWGVAMISIGASVVVLTAQSNIKEWDYKTGEGSQGVDDNDLLFSIFGIFCILAATIGYRLETSTVFGVILAAIAMIGIYYAFMQKETKHAGSTAMTAIMIFILAALPLF